MDMATWTLDILPQAFTVCKAGAGGFSALPLDDPFCFLGKTDSEVSLVCETRHTPADCAGREDGWRALRVRGPLDFSLVGVLARLTGALAGAGVGLFAVSTFDTDYLLVREERLADAAAALEAAGCRVVERGEGNHA